jgi:hypothetical protein
MASGEPLKKGRKAATREPLQGARRAKENFLGHFLGIIKKSPLRGF